MSQAYQQLCLEEESQKFVAINTSKGLFHYNRLPLGISAATRIFQKVIENLLQKIANVVVYLDNILITGSSEEQHLTNLSEVLKWLQQAGLQLKKDKCEFLAASVVYLGHRIDVKGLHPTNDKIDAISRALTPKNCTDLKGYLGFLNYYNKFMPSLATELAPLYQLLHKSTSWQWGNKKIRNLKFPNSYYCHLNC